MVWTWIFICYVFHWLIFAYSVLEGSSETLAIPKASSYGGGDGGRDLEPLFSAVWGDDVSIIRDCVPDGLYSKYISGSENQKRHTINCHGEDVLL